MPSRNRTAGHNWERTLVQMLRDNGYPFAVTSRSESRSRDDQKVDVINHNEHTNGRLPFNFQAKNVKGHVAYAKLLSEMPLEDDCINVIAHKQTAKVGERFLPVGNYAILSLSDFFTLIKLSQVGRPITTENIKWTRAS